MTHALEKGKCVTMGENKDNPNGKRVRQWADYNASQTAEKHQVLKLLSELCKGIQTPGPKSGKPPLDLREILFCLVFKVYIGRSSRRVNCDFREVRDQGYLTHVPHFNSVSKYLRCRALTPLLKGLIEQSSLPLARVEDCFAVDSTGLSTCRRRRMYDRHQRKFRLRREWVKLHAVCGVQTKVITCAEVSKNDVSDQSFFEYLIRQTAMHFRISEASADAGYHSASHQRLVLILGDIPYIAYKRNSTPYGTPKSTFWKEMLRLFKARHPDFMQHYFKRNNVESAFHMLKAKFGKHLKCKTWTGQVNEALCKVLCHNLCVLVHSIYELGLAPEFWENGSSVKKIRRRLKPLRRHPVPERLEHVFRRISLKKQPRTLSRSSKASLRAFRNRRRGTV